MDDYQRYTLSGGDSEDNSGGLGCSGSGFLWIIVIAIIAEILRSCGSN